MPDRVLQIAPARFTVMALEEEVMALEWNVADFSVEDLLSMAVAMEQKGYDFYTEVIELSPERRVKNEIRFLREEEARHKTLFQDMLKKKGRSPSAKLGGALDAILQRELIDPLAQLRSSKKISSNSDALGFGVAMERKSIEFYQALAALPGASALASDIALIIAEEEGHLRKLSVMLAY
jgi:rubrerythrin